MRQRKIVLFTIFVSFLATTLFGCASSIPFQAVSPIKRAGTSYTIGQSITVSTGTPLLTVYNKYVVPAYTPKYSFQPPNAGIWSMPPITPGQIWVVKYSIEGNYVVFSPSHRADIGIEIRPNGELGNDKAWVSALVLPQHQGAVRMLQSEWKVPDPQLFIESELDSPPQKNSFKAELIYSGVMNNVVILSYREYVDNFARPAFYQEMKYDLKESNEIAFRTLKLKILEANNNQISFVVLDDGGLPWIK